ncbi:ABC transporter ATP-binding protein [Citricoccus sp. GCM10030269]|uniref:ABC transporter ATP-binding protein n=1 Tax=Citricoccus sp. GCM10030269 TaxID=3273388 RepID=UPI003608624D
MTLQTDQADQAGPSSARAAGRGGATEGTGDAVAAGDGADVDASPSVAVRLRGATLGYGGHPVVGPEQPVDLDLPAGKTTAIIGANGCGKSTLLRGLTRQLPLTSGSLDVFGRSTEGWGSRSYARTVALLPQSPVVPEGMTVEQLVDRGRHPHRGWFGARSAQDTRAIAQALELADLVSLAGRDVAELSGGQRQRAWLALVLAQQTPVVLLDEPTSYLDLSHQVELMDLIKALPDPTGTRPRATVVAVLHELNLAGRSADHIVAMAGGQIVAQGSPREVLTPENLHAIYGLDADVVHDPLLGHPVVLPRTQSDRAAGLSHGPVAGPAAGPSPKHS